MPEESLTYADVGVDIDQAERALAEVSDAIRETYTEHVVSGIGPFGGIFRAEFPGIERPLLVSSIDGVGTKVAVAVLEGYYSGLGADIVNHCVNDILCQGARPLFFLDYFGSSRFDADAFAAIVQSAALACRAAGCALIGGETATLPDVYVGNQFDLVGAIVGVVDEDHKLPKGKLQPGDALIGIASSGLHTNGYSLARHALFETAGYSTTTVLPGLEESLGRELLRPHRSYLAAVYPLLREDAGICAAAHITGGGLPGNLARVLAVDAQAIIDRRSWTPPAIFRVIQDAGGIADSEMYRVFNMGIGMVLICRRETASAVTQRLNQAGEMAAVIGEVQAGPRDVQLV
jgi:phosphoribosylformylglycinamidine cyclo-ligase